MRWVYQHSVDYVANLTVRWLRSRAAFVQVVLGTVLWIPLVVIGVDKHGFLYLYMATALSLITQVPLAMLGYQAGKNAEAAESKTAEVLTALLATMTSVHELTNATSTLIKESHDLLEESHDLLEEIAEDVADDDFSQE